MSTDNIKYKRLKLRIYPNKPQEILINKTFGCCRFIYNLHLDEWNKYYESIKNLSKEEQKEKWKSFKPKTEKEWKEEYPFMKEVATQSLQQSIRNCDVAFKNFFTKKQRFPKFKSKKNNYQSYQEVQCGLKHINVEFHKIRILKLGWVNYRHKVLPEWFSQIKDFKSITVEKTPSGRYFASCLFEIENKVQKVEDRKDSIGLDFSPELCYVDSDGNNAKDNFGYISQKQVHYKQLRKYQRKLARKTKGSNNYRKTRIKLARVEEHIANCRRDWIEKETLRLVTNYDKVVVENLNLKGISAFLHNAKNMNDTSWGMFVERLIAKGQDYNCSVIKADRYFPSSQLCSNCGYQYHELTLNMRKWTCPSCHKEHIRDINAAINLKNYIFNIPKEFREFMPAEDMEELASLALKVSEYPMKQEFNLSEGRR